MDTPINNQIRPPAPRFYTHNQQFLFKKARTSTPCNKKIPPRPPCKSVPPISRFFRQPVSYKAQAISFKDNSDSSLSKCYDESREELYFDQCFEVIKKIGSGSFGDVYKVRSREDGKFYAVKKSRERFKGKSDRKRKLEEVAKHEQLPKHSNLVRFYKAWEERQHLYIQTELCETSLSNFAEMNHDIPEKVIWNYLADLLMAVKHLHDHDLVHLDIKPDNIFISKDEICKLGDFGLVIDLTKGDINEATEGDPKYLAKELMQGKFTMSADIFSLGITILELACDLDLPSGGDGWHQLRNGKIPQQITNYMSTDLKNVIEMMMHPNHRLRPSATQLLNYPKIKSVARKRLLKVFFKETVTQIQDSFTLFMNMIMKILLINTLFNWIKKFNRSNDDYTPTHASGSEKLTSLEWDNSFSDDEVFDNSISISQRPDFLDAEKSSTSSDEKPIDYTAFKNSVSGRPYFSTTAMNRHKSVLNSTPLTMKITPLKREFENNEYAIKNSFNPLGLSNLNQKLSFCDLSDDDTEECNGSLSSIGPKNLLSVFEEIESDDK